MDRSAPCAQNPAGVLLEAALGYSQMQMMPRPDRKGKRMAFWYLHTAANSKQTYNCKQIRATAFLVRCSGCLLKLPLNPSSVLCKVCVHPNAVGMKVLAGVHDGFCVFCFLYLPAVAFCLGIGSHQVSVNGPVNTRALLGFV